MSDPAGIPVKLPRRDRDGHKGNFGRVLVVGGSAGMIGAPALAANGALRGGAGLVTMALPADIQQICASLCQCATSVPLETDQNGCITAEGRASLNRAVDQCDVIAAGPGLSTGTDRQQVIRLLLEREKPLVIDADGLNGLAGTDSWTSIRKCPVVLTPHPGEFVRLAGGQIPATEPDRREAAAAAMKRWLADAADLPLVLVLKGAGTVVTDGTGMYGNTTGNPGMATGGSGDVLTGLVAAMVCRGLSLFEGSCLAVWIHGRAGDLAADVLTEESMIASDLLDFIPPAMKDAVV